MKRILIGIAILAVLGVSTAGVLAAATPDANKVEKPAKAALSAKLVLSEEGDRLWCRVTIAGVERGKTVAPLIKWTAPEKAPLFLSSEWQSPKVRTTTKSYRTLVTEVGGKTYRAVGVWKITVLVDGEVIGEISYEVK